MKVADRIADALPSGSSNDKVKFPSWFGRAGLVGRGLLYVVVGFLAIRVAFGDPKVQADQNGALSAVASQPFGRWVVFLLGLLFVSYAIYRYTEAAIDPEDDGTLKRLAAAFRGTLYLGFAFTAASIAFGGGSSSGGGGGGQGGGGGDRQRDMTMRVLGIPGGRFVVMAIGLGVIGAGLWHLWRAATGKFAKDLKEDEMPENIESTMRTVGTVGSVARGVAFALVGTFLVLAGIQYDPSEPVGLDESLAKLASAPAGPWLLSIVGIGLMAYGLFAVGRSRYQRILGQ